MDIKAVVKSEASSDSLDYLFYMTMSTVLTVVPHSP